MEMSVDIMALASALAKAQGQIEGAQRNSVNPYFNSTYADLQSVWNACRKPLTDNGLSILQSPSTETTTEGLRVSVETLLLHASGQWIRGVLTVSAHDDSPQAAGSCISYLKRYALQAFTGVAPADDDDGEAAQGRGGGLVSTRAPESRPPSKTYTPTPNPEGYLAWLDALRAIALEGTAALETAWHASTIAYRRHLTTAAPDLWVTLKAIAAQQAA